MRFTFLIPRRGLALMAALVALMLMLAVCPAAGAKDGPDRTATDASRQAADAYKKAYELILSKEYAKAQKEFAQYIETYRDSRWYTDARYWYCYALMESTNDYEKAFDCFREFVTNYPDSKYRETAEENAVILAKRLSKANPKYSEYLEELHGGGEEEITLALVMALIERGDENTVVELLNETNDPDIRRWLVYALEDCESPACKEKLVEVAKTDPDPEVRRHAIYALSDSKDGNEIVPLMIDLLKTEKDPDIRRNAVWVLAESRDPAAVDALIDIALTEKDPDMARAATYALAETEDPRAKAALEQLMRESTDVEIKRAALYSLVEDAGVEALGALKQTALSEGNPDLRRAAVWAIAEMRDEPTAAQALAEIFKTSEDREVRKAALYGLSDFDEEVSIELLKEAALSADDEELARAGMYALVERINRDDFGYIIEIYEKTPYPEVRRAAFHVIVENGSGDALPLMTKVLKTETDPDLRASAVFALREADDQGEAVKILSDVARNDPSTRVRRAAIQVLGYIDTDEARDALLEIFRERSRDKKQN